MARIRASRTALSVYRPRQKTRLGTLCQSRNAVITPGLARGGLQEDIIRFFAKCLAANGHKITPHHLSIAVSAYVADSKAEAVREFESLDDVGLGEHLLSRKPRALSGGQRQRVAIAGSLVLSFCIVTSSAEVGSSAISSTGLGSMAKPINTR